MFKDKLMYVGLLTISLVSGLVFYCSFLFQEWQMTNAHWVSDLPVHTHMVVKFAQKHSFPVYSLWYKLIYVFSGFSDKYRNIAFASIFVLTGLTVAKYLITYYILKVNSANTKIIALISFALIFVMPVISYYSCSSEPLYGRLCINDFHIYLGNISPNQWHNSTLILSMPFNLLFFFFSVKNIESKNKYSFLIMGVLSVVSILCKPNYALAFLPLLCVTILVLNIKSKKYLRGIARCLLVAVPSILVLIYQWYFTFISNDLFEHGQGSIIAPFLVWSIYSPHVFLSLIFSIVFPLLILILYLSKIDSYLVLSWLTFLVALCTVVLLSEDLVGGGGNFFWGAIAANYLLFVFSIRFLLKQPVDWKSKMAYMGFGLHFLSGCFLLISFFSKQTSLIM